MRSALTSMCYSPRFLELKQNHFKNTLPVTRPLTLCTEWVLLDLFSLPSAVLSCGLQGQLTELEAFLSKGNKEWFAGSLSIADFVLYETFDVRHSLTTLRSLTTAAHAPSVCSVLIVAGPQHRAEESR